MSKLGDLRMGLGSGRKRGESGKMWLDRGDDFWHVEGELVENVREKLTMKEEPKMEPSGVLLIDKAPDMTSHDVVAIARRTLQTKKIGHCGTLDPMATGLLMLVIGKATKLQDRLMSESKVYEGTLRLGQVTSTQDREGEVTEEREVPALSEGEIREAFEAFLGDFSQIPPMVSAIKKDGVPLYKLARQGKVIEREPRAVSVTKFEITEISLPEVSFVVHCSKGFYVRSYAHDIGQRLGCGAHLSALRRVKSGDFTLERAVEAMDLKHGGRENALAALLSLEEILAMKEGREKSLGTDG